MNKNREVIKKLRGFARNHIVKRLKEMENSEFVPSDILSIIINNASNLRNIIIKKNKMVKYFYFLRHENGSRRVSR